MKFKKILKYLLITWISLTIILVVGAIIKYNLDLNRYINQEDTVTQTQKNKYSPNQTLSKVTYSHSIDFLEVHQFRMPLDPL